MLSFRRKSIKPPSTVISLLKSLNLFKYRGTRAGVRRRCVPSGVERDGQKITVITGRRPLNQLKLTSSVRKPSITFLVRIRRAEHVGPTIIASTNQFAVPKLLFTNICSLDKLCSC